MSPKLVSVCFIGLGGSTAAYGIYKHNQMEKGKVDVAVTESIRVTEVTDKDTITESAMKCTTPTHKALIPKDDKVEYYVCTDITDLTSNTITPTDITSTVVIDEIHIFKQTKHTVVTSPSITSTQWTYTQKGKTPSIDFHWLKDPSEKTIFFIKKLEENKTNPFDLTKKSGIEELAGYIERLRKEQIITISAEKNTKVLDEISCTTPKLLINSSDPDIEYYHCASITGDVSGTDPILTASTIQTKFQQDTTFKTKKGTKYTITKWAKQNTTNSHFFWFQPLDTTAKPENKTTFFFIKTDSSKLEDSKLSEIVIELANFHNTQTT